jgi:hypothetical protein
MMKQTLHCPNCKSVKMGEQEEANRITNVGSAVVNL